MLEIRPTTSIVAIAVVSILGSISIAQKTQNHSAPWFSKPGRAFFFQLDSNGKQLFVNRSTAAGGEELVQVPVAGGVTQVWYANAKSEIYNHFAVSGDGQTVAFAKGTESRVYILASPAASPVTVANVEPDRDPRQLILSRDGRWVAFTAAGVKGGGPIGRIQVNLYVSATNGSAIHRITSTPLSGRYIAFVLSADGATVVWMDDPNRGPIVANRDGTGASRLPALSARIERVYCSADGKQIYCSTVEATAVKLWSIARTGSNWTLEDEAQAGAFKVAREENAIRLIQSPGRTTPGTCWSVSNNSSRESMFTFVWPQYSGSMALSGDGRVVVWREGLKTRVWQAGS